MSTNGSIGKPLSSQVKKCVKKYTYTYTYIHTSTHIYTQKYLHKKKNTSPIKKGGGGKKIKEFSEQK